MKIRVDLIAEDEGGYSVICPELPGCQSQGESRDEAIANIKEAIELYLTPEAESSKPGVQSMILEF